MTPSEGANPPVRKQSVDFLKDLLNAPSPSGYEQPAMEVVREYVTDFADEVKTDVHGNVIAAVNPEGSPRVMLAGHCDQIGMIVKWINDDGYIYFSSIGGIDTAVLSGLRVQVHADSGPISGVVGRTAIHLLSGDERGKAQSIDKFWIDIGEDPVWVQAFVDRVTDHLIAVGVESIRRWDMQDTGIQINDDVAANWGPFVGPETYEWIFLPPLRRMVRAYRDAGARFIMHHADGNVLPLLDI